MMVQVRVAQESDLDAILTLERATENAPHWPTSVYSAILSGGDASRCLMVADSSGLVDGFAVGLVQPGEPGVGEIESVVVGTAQRRAGIGRALCVAVVDWCRERGADEMVLEVRAASAGAIALYTGLGFRETARRPRYYIDPVDDAVLMTLGRQADTTICSTSV